MSCPRRRQCGGGNSWSYSWSTCNGVTTYQTQGNVPAQYQQNVQSVGEKADSSKNSEKVESGSNSSQDYHEYGLYLHNWYRKRHGSPKMALIDRLNNAADAYAYKLACRGQMVHTSGLDYNENLYMSSDTRASKKDHVRQACKLWYDENKLYSYSRPGFSMQTGHFTAMVWKATTQLGIGYGSANGWVVIVACYKPLANMQGEFGNNVLQWREVEDSDDEKKATKEKEAVDKAKQKDEKNVKDSTKEQKSGTGLGKTRKTFSYDYKYKEEAEAKKKSVSHSSNDDDGSDSSDDDGSDSSDDDGSGLKEDEIPEEAKQIFEDKADKDNTIGCLELQEILNSIVKVAFKFDGFDKTICSLLISMMTLRNGEKPRIDLDIFTQILQSVEGFLDAYSEFDKDNSGTLDPFELKSALEEAGYKVNYKTFQILQAQFADEDGNMEFRGFVLCFILLGKLQIASQIKSSSGVFEDFSMKDWIQGELNTHSN